MAFARKYTDNDVDRVEHMNDKPCNKRLEPPQFAVFWCEVASELGTSRLRINTQAKNIHQLVDRNSDCRSYLHDTIRQSYKMSKCHHLGSPISLEHVLDLLGETAYKLQNNQHDDLFDIELLEEIAWHINDRYAPHLSHLIKTDNGDTTRGKAAQIISFPSVKAQHANNGPVG